MAAGANFPDKPGFVWMPEATAEEIDTLRGLKGAHEQCHKSIDAYLGPLTGMRPSAALVIKIQTLIAEHQNLRANIAKLRCSYCGHPMEKCQT